LIFQLFISLFFIDFKTVFLIASVEKPGDPDVFARFLHIGPKPPLIRGIAGLARRGTPLTAPARSRIISVKKG
jgi:hypothetical protein